MLNKFISRSLHPLTTLFCCSNSRKSFQCVNKNVYVSILMCSIKCRIYILCISLHPLSATVCCSSFPKSCYKKYCIHQKTIHIWYCKYELIPTRACINDARMYRSAIIQAYLCHCIYVAYIEMCIIIHICIYIVIHMMPPDPLLTSIY